jgi:hypothetical protein
MTQFQTVEQLQAEIERLRALVKAAYIEGWDNSSEENAGGVPMAWWDGWWPETKTYAALQPKEGEG